MEMSIVIAGDVVVSPMHEHIDNIIDKELTAIIKNADYSIVNFEAPVKTDCSLPIIKTGKNLCQSASVIAKLKNAGFNCCTLANNHFRDYGNNACENTLTLLEAKGVESVGGGMNLHDTRRILYKVINDIRVAFINVCEQEWSIATENRAGANPLHPLTQYYQIQEAKAKTDFVVLICHGGTEHYRFPSPEFKQLHRFFIDAGADAVVNHHQHCFSGYEMYHGKPIFYGLGNFLFDNKLKKNQPWNYGYLVELKFSKPNKISFELHPYEQCNDKFGVFARRDNVEFHAEIKGLNRIIVDEEQLRMRWNEYVSQNRSFYNPAIIPFRSRILKKLHKIKLLPSLMSKYQLRYIYDVINCDTHRSRFLEYLENKINER